MYIFHSIHHYFPPFWLLEPLGTPLRTFWVIYFLSLTFRATVLFDVWRPYHIFLLVWRSEPFFIPIYAFWVISFLSFDVQNHCSVWHPVPPSFVSSASRAIVHIHLKTLSHHPSLFWRSKSPLLDCIIQDHSPWHSYSLALHILPSWLCIYPRLPHRITLCLSLIRHCSSRFLFSLLMT